MDDYKDLTGITRIARTILFVYLAANLLYSLLSFYQAHLASQPALVEGPIGLLAILFLTLLVATFVIVGRWIYLANRNAHGFAPDLPIRPGWAVGWYFIPFANLIKPFEAMKQTWLASHYGAGWETGTAPRLLNQWWALWLATSILGNISFRISDPVLGTSLDLVSALLSIPLCFTLAMIMRRVTDAQKGLSHREVFA